MTEHKPSVRIDKWLWAARFFKTRSQAREAIDGGKIHIDGGRAKPSRDLHTGQEIVITLAHAEYTLSVRIFENKEDFKFERVQGRVLIDLIPKRPWPSCPSRLPAGRA